MKKIVVIVIVLLILGGGIFFFVKKDREKKDVVVNYIETSGTLEVIETDCSFKIAGKIVELPILEGDSIKKGQFIGRLSSQSIDQEIAVQKSSIDTIKAQFPKIDIQINQTDISVKKEIENAKIKVDETYARYESIKSGSRDEEITRAEHLVDQTEHVLLNAKKNYERAENLYEKGAISQQDRDNTKTSYLSAFEENKQAKANLSLLKAGAKSEDIEASFQVYNQAVANYELTLAKNFELKKLEEDKKILASQLKNAEDGLKLLEVKRADHKLYSPVTGTVLRKVAEEGENVTAGGTVLTVGNLDEIYLRGYVAETDLAKVKLGQRCELRTDTYPDKIYNGKITYISDKAEFTPKNLTTKDDRVKLVYRIKISADNSSRDLKPGMIADAFIYFMEDVEK